MLRNTVLWVVIVPLAATFIGLVYAVLIDRTRFESFAKTLIFLPMAISLVGASIIWKFVYEFRPDIGNIQQIGLLNQLLVWLGLPPPQQFLLNQPWNTLFLIAVMVWIQAGFAMTVLSAAIKAIPPTTSSRPRASTACTVSACSGSSPSRASAPRSSSWSPRSPWRRSRSSTSSGR